MGTETESPYISQLILSSNITLLRNVTFLTQNMCLFIFFSLFTFFCVSVWHTDVELWVSEESRCVKYWSHHHRSFLTGQADSATTILHLLYISRRELLFLVAHFLTAGQNAGSATQQCPWSWQRFKVLLRDISTSLGHFSIHCHPATVGQAQKVLAILLLTAEESILTR